MKSSEKKNKQKHDNVTKMGFISQSATGMHFVPLNIPLRFVYEGLAWRGRLRFLFQFAFFTLKDRETQPEEIMRAYRQTSLIPSNVYYARRLCVAIRAAV